MGGAIRYDDRYHGRSLASGVAVEGTNDPRPRCLPFHRPAIRPGSGRSGRLASGWRHQGGRPALCRGDESIFATGNADLLDEVVAASYVDRTPSLTRTGGTATPDLAGLKTTFAAVHDIFPESTVSVDAAIVDGDMAALLVTFHGMRGPDTTVDGVLVLRIADGKVVEGWNYERGGEAPLQPMFEATPAA